MQFIAKALKRRRGLTLIELLMVIMVTMILSAVVYKATATTLDWANNSRMSIEVSQLSKALDNFSLQFGEYPPDFHDQMAVWKFMKARFPNCPHSKYPDFSEHSPASALYFWLGGPNGKGFSANPLNPFDDGPHRIGPYFNFKPEQLKLVDGVMQYFPPRGKGVRPTSTSAATKTRTRAMTAIPAGTSFGLIATRFLSIGSSRTGIRFFARETMESSAPAITTRAAPIMTKPTSTTSPVSRAARRWAGRSRNWSRTKTTRKKNDTGGTFAM